MATSARTTDKRREKAADKKASAPVVGERQNLVWSVTIEGGTVTDWLVAAPFRPTPGFMLEVGRKPAVLARLVTVSDDGPPVPPKWGGRQSILVSPDRQTTFKVAIKSKQGDKKHQERAALLPSGRRQQGQGAYKAPEAAPVAKTPPRFWGVRLGSRDARFWWILYTRLDPVVGDRVDGEATASITEVVGPLPKPSKVAQKPDQVRLVRAGLAPQAATLTPWEAGHPSIKIGDKVYDGNPVGYPPVLPPVAPRPAPVTALTVAAPRVDDQTRGDDASSTTTLSVLRALQGALPAVGLLDFLKRADDARTPAQQMRVAEAAADAVDSSAPVRMLLTPQGREALDLVEKAFPGAKLIFGAIPAGVFQTLANGASHVATKKYRVDAYYRTCMTWAEGAHYMSGGWRGPPHPTWAIAREETARVKSPAGFASVGGPKSACDHDPVDCNCLGKDVSDRVLMFGMDETVTPSQVAAWTARYGKVLSIVPNPAFIYFQSRLEKTTRLISVAGDASPLRLPAGNWYGPRTSAKVPAWFWQPRQELTWTRSPIGAAFLLVEFGVIKGRGGTAPMSVLGAIQHTWSPTRTLDGHYEVDGLPVCRVEPVEAASQSLAGRPLGPTAWDTCERTASRVVRETPGPYDAASEIRAAAETAWVLTRRARHEWALSGWLAELFWPAPDIVDHGRMRPFRDLLVAVGALLATAFAQRYAPPWLWRALTSPSSWHIRQTAVVIPFDVQIVGTIAGGAFWLTFGVGLLRGRTFWRNLFTSWVAMFATSFSLGWSMASISEESAVYVRGLAVLAARAWEALPPLPRLPDLRPILRGHPAFREELACSVGSVHDVTFWRDVVLAPLLEEGLKHGPHGGVLTVLIVFIEMCRHLILRGLEDGEGRGTLARVTASCVHAMTYLLPLPAAVTLHAAWNLNAWWWHRTLAGPAA